MIDGLGEGVLGRGVQLSDAIHALPISGANFNTVAYSILAKPGAAAQLLPATDAGISALNAARNEIAQMFAPGATTLKPFIAERRQFDQAIADAPSTLSAVSLGFGAPGQRLLASLRRVAAAADQVLPAAPLALSSATRLLEQAPGPLQKTSVVLHELPSAVPSTLKILTSLRPDLAPLRNAFTWLIGPVTSLGEHGCDIKSFGETWRSILLHGVLPAGPSGPRDGFRAVLGAFGPGALGAELPVGPISYPQNNVYKPPCMYFPGSVYDLASISTLLGTK
jgi:hypothetical protein